MILILGAGAGGTFLVIRLPKKAGEAPPARQPAEYLMTADSLERRFYKGDSILIPVGTSQYKLELSGLGEAVTIGAPGGSFILDLGQQVNADLDNNGIPELRITAGDFVKNNSEAGALLRFEIDNAPAETTVSFPSAEDAVSSLSGAVAIFSSPSAFPFTLQAAFQGYCMFRWEILFERERQDRNEQYFQRGNELNIQAQNGIRIWVSNAQAAKLQVIGGGRTVPVELGGAGEVVVADIRWMRDEENRYRLMLVRLETGNP
jgi:hypothetical protein